jgi:hypothetical protein
MAQRFPSFALVRTDDAQLHWVGTLAPVPEYPFVVAASYSDRYPYVEPELRLLEPELETGAPHVYAETKTLCVHPAKGWDPERGTVAGSLALASAWLFLYVQWLETGERF